MAPHKREAHCKMGWLCFPLSALCCASGYLNGLPIWLTFVFEPTVLAAAKQVTNFSGKHTIIYLNGVK